MSDVEQVPGDDDIEIDENDDRTFRNKLPNCLNKLIKIVFSTPGLVILVILYSIMGAFIFPILEAPARNNKNNMALAKSREDCLRELWTITEKLNVLYEKHWKELIDEQLRRFEGTIVAATRNGATSGIDYNKTTKWSFSEALLYSVTVITTIGHGSLTPKTSGGKIVTIFYALIGVPLMLMCLSSLGGLLAEALQYSYTKFCCARNRRKNRNSSSGVSDRTCSTTSCIGNSGHEMDCNLCKYDAVSTETKLHNSYEYTAVNERDDSCHLLHNSPLKVNHSSPLMQVKSAAIHHSSPIKQYCSSQKQHEQQQQQKIETTPLKQHNNQHQYQKFNHLHHQIQQHGSPQHYQMTLPKNYRLTTVAAAAATAAASQISTNSDGSTTTLSETMGGGGVGGGCTGSTQTIGSTISIGGSGGNICIPHGTTTTTVYFPITTTNPLNNQYTCNTIHFNQQQQHQQQSPHHQQHQQQLVKYHTIQLQQHSGTTNSNTNASTNLKSYDQSIVGQTSATVHGIRRGKYIPKPMPHEINMLLAESDLSSSSLNNRNDSSSNNNNNSSPNNSTCNLGISSINEQTINCSTGSTVGNTVGGGGCVDIMEDEEENEQNRSISMSCPHGTPSRIPLLQSSTSSSPGPGSPSYRHSGMDIEMEDKSNNYGMTSIGNKFCNKKNTNTNTTNTNSSSSSLYQEKNQENGNINNTSTSFKQQQQQLQQNNKNKFSHRKDDCIDDNIVDDCENPHHHHHHQHNQHYNHSHHQHEQQQQVPITIVLFILTSYIFLGTVIFAFWENWSFIDGAYFCFVTLSTIGYGDFLPLHTFHHGPDVQLFACCIYLLMGLVLVAMSFSILETQLMWKCKRIAVRLKLAKD